MSWIRKFLTPPIFPEDEEKTRAAGFLNIIVLVGGAIILLASPGLVYFNETVADMWLSVGLIAAFLALLAVVFLLLHNGFVRAGSFLLCIAVWISVTGMIFFFGGLRTAGSAGYLLVIFIAGLLLGGRWAVAFGGLSLLSAIGVFVVYYSETAHLVPPAIQEAIHPRGYVDFDDLFILLAFAVLMAVLLGLVRRSIVNMLNRARSHERALAEMNRELQVSRDELRARTRKLEQRAIQLRSAAEITRDTTAARGLDDMLNRAVNMIRYHFGFYHVGIFLLDEAGEYAVLRMATGDAGRQLLEQRHRLRVGKSGIVGYVASSGEPRIALDVGTDAVYFRNPLLPETRSEMALPLRIGRRVTGVLDVQSREEAAFDDEDASILQTIADQLAVAIENARLIQEMQQTMHELEVASRRYTRETWQTGGEQALGYRYRRMDIEPVVERPPEARQAWLTGESVVATLQPQDDDDRQAVSAAAIPIKLRGQVIGVLNLRTSREEISPRTVSQIEEVADRLAMALENARLLEETERRARREQLLSDMTAQFTQSLDMDTLLRSAVRELGRLPNVAEASVHVGTLGDAVAVDGDGGTEPVI
ncbi:MAG: GAF domain-containing protein [Anaerolineae bacterium]|nr:GAF domain-containing protein [Anaerolineae bacterium]